MISKSERRKIITDLKDEIKAKLGIDTRIVSSESGRDGTLLYASVNNKKGVRGLEVVSYANGDLLMGVSVNDNDSSALVKDIMRNNGYILVKEQKNPRYNFCLHRFGEAYDCLINHPELND